MFTERCLHWKQKGTAMRMFAAATPDDSTSRKAVPAEILRRLAFGRPRRPIQTAAAIAPAAPAADAVAPQRSEPRDLDQRVRESGEW
jgi:hypothetical protein